jgi:D-aminoacyl-tRNA deacylase
MRAVIQRVSEGNVVIDGTTRAVIGRGYVILLGIARGDTERSALHLAEKCAALRVMEDPQGKMNLSLDDVHGSALVISQFTLYGDAQRGNRPSFISAAPPDEAEPLYNAFVARMRKLLGSDRVATGEFRQNMKVGIVNEGPVTILLESQPDQRSQEP